jgi:hypothetical protein
VPVGPEPHDFRADAREFWQGIRDGVDPAQLTAIQERLKAHCPSVDAFSFEVVDEEGAPAGEFGTSPRTLEPGTPKNAVDVWNSAKLVALTKVLSAVRSRPGRRISRPVVFLRWTASMEITSLSQWSGFRLLRTIQFVLPPRRPRGQSPKFYLALA